MEKTERQRCAGPRTVVVVLRLRGLAVLALGRPAVDFLVVLAALLGLAGFSAFSGFSGFSAFLAGVFLVLVVVGWAECQRN